MTLPLHYTLIRHGFSERNRFRRYYEDGQINVLEELVSKALWDGHDSDARLTNRGIEQAELTGMWLRENWEPFNRFYVSPHVRARETAGHLRLNGDWIVDDRFRERDWGEVALTDRDYGETMTEISLQLRDQNYWYWKPQGGESLATGVRLRVESIMNSLHRRGETVSNVVAVSHGENIDAHRFVIEKLTPNQYNQDRDSKKRSVANTMVLQYSRVNPYNPSEVRNNYHWRRAVCPWDDRKSWDNGEWVMFTVDKQTDQDLLDYAESHGRYFADEV